MSVVHVLIVDDAEEWRDFIACLLTRDKRFNVVGKAPDGSHAIQMATQTKPTVILLDIRMPRLNGLEAAKQILALEPQARIIYVTGETDYDTVLTAFQIGAAGYVLKAKVGQDLFAAIDIAIDGGKFVSGGLLPPTARGKGHHDQDSVRRSSKDDPKPMRFSFAESYS